MSASKEYLEFLDAAREVGFQVQRQMSKSNAGVLAANTGPRATRRAIEQTEKLLLMLREYQEFRWAPRECGFEEADINGTSRAKILDETSPEFAETYRKWKGLTDV